jgi:hypothetical protein
VLKSQLLLDVNYQYIIYFMSEHNPWDNTIWDPIDSEQAIEDPMHGPSAIHNMLQTPPMPRGDGTYYQPGSYYMNGTAYVDSQDRPVHVTGGSTVSGRTEAIELQEWITAYHEGEDALTALEAKRQQERLGETGIACAYKLSDVCPGGERLENCETGSSAYGAAQEWATKNDTEKPGNGTAFTTLAWASGECENCALACSAAVKTVDGKADETRVSFFKPDPNVQTINLTELNTQSFVSDPVALKAFQKVFDELRKDDNEA